MSAEAKVPLRDQPVCPKHGSDAAVGTCERCGDFVCPLCTGVTDGRLYCQECASLLEERGELRSHRNVRSKGALILFLASFATWTPLLGIVCGIGVVIAAVALLRDKRLTRSQRGFTIAAISMAATALVLNVSWFFLLLGMG